MREVREVVPGREALEGARGLLDLQVDRLDLQVDRLDLKVSQVLKVLRVLLDLWVLRVLRVPSESPVPLEFLVSLDR